MYAWELPFQQLIGEIRDKELEMLKKSSYLNSTVAFMLTSPSILVRAAYLIFNASKLYNFANVQVSLATFATYTLINLNNPDQRLTAEKAFVSLSIFNILRAPLSMLPNLIPLLVQVCVIISLY